MTRRAGLAGMIAALAVFAGWNETESAMSPLASYEWSHRPLLVFLPETEDPRKRDMTPESPIADGVHERDMLLVFVTLETAHIWNGDGIDTLDATPAALRQNFGVGKDQFEVILVGKDGTEKKRWAEPPDWRTDVFPLIDSMPMRRQEMRDSD